MIRSMDWLAAFALWVSIGCSGFAQSIRADGSLNVPADSSPACLVIYLRGGRSKPDPRESCSDASLSDAALVRSNGLASVYGDLLPVLAHSFDVAEENVCGSPGCATRGKTVRLVVLAQGMADLQRWDNTKPEGFDLYLTGGFIDYALKPTAYVMDDLIANRLSLDGDASLLGRWIRAIGLASGKGCTEPVFWLTERPMAPSDTLRVKLHYASQVSALSFLFAHELAHKQSVNDRCGASPQASRVQVEFACDSVALVRGVRRRAIEPVSLIAALTSLGHWELLRSPQILRYNRNRIDPGGSSKRVLDAAPTRDWIERAFYVNDLWGRLCGVWGAGSMTCAYPEIQKGILDPLRAFPLPKDCVLSPADDTSLTEPTR